MHIGVQRVQNVRVLERVSHCAFARLTEWYWILYEPFSSSTIVESRSSEIFITSS